MAAILCLSDLWLPFPGGAERLMFNLARDLDRRPEHSVHVLTGYETPQRFDGPPVERDDLDLDQYGWQRIEKRMSIGWPDVILTHHLYARTFHRQLVATGLPIVQIVLNGPRMPEAALAVWISQHVVDRLRAEGPRPRSEHRQPHDLVINPPAFADVVAPYHGDAVGFIKPIKHKGVELVYAMAAARPERRFVVLRGEWQGLEILSDLPNVEYLEPVDDIREFYRECRVILMPSLSEDAGTVAQEAALNGLPCISSDVGGLPETNAGGIRLRQNDLGLWLSALDALTDRAGWYEAVVTRQRRFLKDPAPGLDALSTAIGAL